MRKPPVELEPSFAPSGQIANDRGDTTEQARVVARGVSEAVEQRFDRATLPGSERRELTREQLLQAHERVATAYLMEGYMIPFADLSPDIQRSFTRQLVEHATRSGHARERWVKQIKESAKQWETDMSTLSWVERAGAEA